MCLAGTRDFSQFIRLTEGFLQFYPLCSGVQVLELETEVARRADEVHSLQDAAIVLRQHVSTLQLQLEVRYLDLTHSSYFP